VTTCVVVFGFPNEASLIYRGLRQEFGAGRVIMSIWTHGVGGEGNNGLISTRSHRSRYFVESDKVQSTTDAKMEESRAIIMYDVIWRHLGLGTRLYTLFIAVFYVYS